MAPSVTFRRATAGDLDAIIGLLTDDVVGADREPGPISDPSAYQRAFDEVAADPTDARRPEAREFSESLGREDERMGITVEGPVSLIRSSDQASSVISSEEPPGRPERARRQRCGSSEATHVGLKLQR